MSQYRYATFDGEKKVVIRTAEIPTAQPDGVIVKITYTGICGSDTSTWKSAPEHYRTTFGHEWTGTIHELGEGVDDLAVGDRVIATVGPPCGACSACVNGHAAQCLTALNEGFCAADHTTDHGGFAEYVSVPRRRVQPVFDGVSDVQAGLSEPVTVTIHGVRRAPFALGATVVVQGAGPIGLFAADHARNAGAGTVVVVETNEARRALAGEMGFTEVFAPGDELTARLDELTGGFGVDIVYEATGVPSLVQVAASMVRRGGTLGLLGFTAVPAEIDYADWQTRELTVISSILYTHSDFHASMAAMASGQIQPEKLHTGTIGLDELQATFEDLDSGSSTHMKVLVDPSA